MTGREIGNLMYLTTTDRYGDAILVPSADALNVILRDIYGDEADTIRAASYPDRLINQDGDTVAIDLSPFGSVNHDGTTYCLSEQAEQTNRLFDGGWNDAEDGTGYTDEWGAIAYDADGTRYRVTWQFEVTKGDEPEADALPWDDDHVVSVERR